MKIHLGIDIGTSKISITAVDINTGKIKTIMSSPNNSNVVYPKKKEWVEQNPIKIKKITFQLIQKILNLRKIPKEKICGIGLTGQMHGMLLVNQKLKPLTNLITWQDQRCMEIFPKKKRNYIQEMIWLAGEKSFYNTGCLPATGFMGSSLFWLKVNKLLPREIYKVSFIHDWIASLLTGNEIYTDYTDAGSSGIFDIVKKEWDFNLIQKLAFEPKILPKIKSSCEIIGKTTSLIEKETNLPKGIPVTCPIGDNQASIIGSLENYKDNVLVNIGTGAQVSIVTEKFRRLKNIDTRCFIENLYILVGASLNGGQVYRLLEKFFKDVGYLFWKIKEKSDLFKTMNKLARKIKDDGLICEPFFFGTRVDPTKLASFRGISNKNMTPAHFIRAVLEGMVNELYDFYYSSMVEGLDYKHKSVICTGNAIKRNRLLCEIISKKFNLPVKLTKYDEEAAYGAALISALGCGDIKNLEEVGKKLL